MTTQKQQSYELSELLNCMICLSEANNPHVCPKCSKIVCYKCIEQWLRGYTMFNKSCPNCKSPMHHAGNFVKIRWFDDIKKCIDSSKNNPVDDGNCNVHNKKLVMFCQECESLVCIDCVNGDHRLHNFQEIDDTYSKILKKVEDKFTKLEENAKKLSAWSSEIEANLAHIDEIKKIEIEDYVTEIEKKRFDLQFEYEWKLSQLNHDLMFKEKDVQELYKDTVFQLEKEKQKVGNELEDIRRAKREFEEIKAQPKSVFIENELKQNYCFEAEEVVVPKRNWMEPSFTKTSEFLVERASRLSNNGVYSDAIQDYYGHSWRLFVKRNTNGTGVGVYIECTNGDSSWQECRIQVVHHVTGEIYMQKFYHFFDAEKKIWGFPFYMSAEDFEKFTNIDKDVMKFYYHIKPHQPIEIELE